ncbi:MAG: hypothetical protein KGM24_01745 [Elusimicrobia bacterium]|nr:hypothetical protein [Elusimicrobiota bacterium]
MLRLILRVYAAVFLVCGILFVFAEGAVLGWITRAAGFVGQAGLSAGGPSLWLGLTGSLMAVIALLAWQLSRAPQRAEAWDALLLSKAVSSGLFVVFAARTRIPLFLGAAAIDGAILAHLLALRASFETARGALSPRRDAPGYEAYFIRACDPATGRALWARRACVSGGQGTKSITSAVFFEPDEGRATIRRWEGGCDWRLDAECAAGAGAGVRWQFAVKSLGVPAFDMVPAWLRALGLSRGYASAFPAARFEGDAELDETTWRFSAGLGSVGHVWGEGLGRGWSWAHAVFDGAEPVVVEALSAQLPPGLRATSVWLWQGGRLSASAGPLRLLLNSSRRDGADWTFSARAGRLSIMGVVSPGPVAELKYDDGRGRRLVCRNSSTSRMTLTLNGPGGSEVLTSRLAAVEHAERA